MISLSRGCLAIASVQPQDVRRFMTDTAKANVGVRQSRGEH
jgi:hypothetical protein